MSGNRIKPLELNFQGLETITKAFFPVVDTNPQLKTEAIELYDCISQYIETKKLVKATVVFALNMILFTVLKQVVESVGTTENQLVN